MDIGFVRWVRRYLDGVSRQAPMVPYSSARINPLKKEELEEFIKSNPGFFKDSDWPKILKCELPPPFEKGKQYLVVVVELKD